MKLTKNDRFSDRDEVMKLLIADDEILTRTGLTTSIVWSDLGIDEVYEASDGVEGLEMAKKYQPDIVLSDVRMPRMNGIDMLYKIREIAPDTSFIFMSGYSDKEYLKAAIKLQAVSYVEKPLDLGEISQAVRTAAERHLQVIESRRSQDLRLNMVGTQLALVLTQPDHSVHDTIDELSRNYCRKYGTDDIFHSAVTIIVKMPEWLEFPLDHLNTMEKQLHDMIRPLHLHIISAEKRSNLFVFHVFRRADFTPQILTSLQSYLKQLFTPFINYHFAIGTPVTGIHHIYDSYSAAVIALQSAFFFAPGTCLTPDYLSGVPRRELPEAMAESFTKALGQADQEATDRICAQLQESCYENPSLLIRTVQSLYFQLFAALAEQRRARQLAGKTPAMAADELLSHTEHFFFYQNLHQKLIDSLNEFYGDLNTSESENSSVYLIKNYIQRHYGNPLLSTKEISEYASLSASYACTVFKNETGQTLNQYLTEYRLKKAQELLNDPRNTVSGVSAMVGYNDSNYFSKAFKKYTGISPTVYRERRLK